jgi:malate dehydrogenase
MRDWVLGTKEIVSMAIPSDGNTYGVPENLIFSFPVTIENNEYKTINGIKIDDAFTKDKIKKTTDELLQERDMVKELLK